MDNAIDMTVVDHPRAELANLHERLDGVWMKYLDCLDLYQSAQAELSRTLSSGFFALTEANFKSSDRRRYGKDYYDERMKASRKFTFSHIAHQGVKSKDRDAVPTLCLITQAAADASDEEEEDTSKPLSEKDPQPTQQPSPPATPVPAESEDGDVPVKERIEETKTEDDHIEEPALEPSPRDPLDWFGILVPRQMRSAQSSFSSAIDGPVLEATKNAKTLRKLEGEIRGLRKSIRKTAKEAKEKS